VIVAVVDTGVKLAHPDLAGQLVAGYDFITDGVRANDNEGSNGGCDGNPDDPGDDAAGGSSYHGTHVAGTVAARTSFSAGNTVGVAGVAWNARIMPLRVLGVGGGTDADIMEALRYAAGLPSTVCGGVAAATPARIVNLSLGGPGFSDTFQTLVTQLRNAGVIFVAAAGNEASSQPFYPAAYDGVISVSAVGPTKTLAPYSSFGATIDVAAPGGDFQRDVDGDGFPDGVLSTFFQDPNAYGYAFYQGTSMATPHVAGVLALMLGINPALTRIDIENALNTGQITEDIGSAQFFGNGLIDAVKAVTYAESAAGGGTVLEPVLRVYPDGLNYGFLADQLLVSASNGGSADQELNLIDVTFTSDGGGSWLTVTPEAVDPEGLGSYRAVVDRSGLADGLYTGTLHFDSDANDVDVAVIMQVGDPTSLQANAGHHYILLVEPGTLLTIAAREVDAANGSYAFSFADVEPGDYLLIAGTDLDNDQIVCDSGEACGAYPTTATIVPITVNADRTDLSFVTGFDVGVSAPSAGVTPSARGYSRQIGESPNQ
jgi:serine protease